MPGFFLFCSVAFIATFLHSCVSDPNQWQLLQVQFVARHGDRTPCNTFPNDPYKHLWSQGFEQLTELGALQHRELGHYLRKRYQLFLPETFHKDEVYIRSSDTDRTILSALNCMQALYDPIHWNSTQTYQLLTNHHHYHHHQQQQHSAANAPYSSIDSAILSQVPIHSVPKTHDQLLKMSSPCPQQKRDWTDYVASSAHFQSVVQPFAQLREYLMRKTGLLKLVLDGEPVVTNPTKKSSKNTNSNANKKPTNLAMQEIKLTWEACDPILVWHRRRLVLPDWVNDSIVQACQDWVHVKHTIRFHPETSRRLRGGPLVKQVLQEFRKRAKGTSSRLLLGYFAHDSTMAAFLSRLGVHNEKQPPLASAVLMELYQRSAISSSTGQQQQQHATRQYAVRFLYRNATQLWSEDLPGLVPPECNDHEGRVNDEYSNDAAQKLHSLCNLAVLEQRMQEKLPLDVEEECGLKCHQQEEDKKECFHVPVLYTTVIVAQTAALVYFLAKHFFL